MERIDILQSLLAEDKGIFLASRAVQAGLSRFDLSKLTERGLLERVGRGVYIAPGEMGDELYSLQERAKKIVYSHETALYLHGMTDRTPNRYSITVPSYYKPSITVKDKCKVYYISPNFLGLGLIKLPSGMGHHIVAYDIERTICDIARSRNKIDGQIFVDALKNYVSLEGTNLNNLSDYANKLGVYKILHNYLEVLL
jgi:predicted transcriptional regulator of viral defense system